VRSIYKYFNWDRNEVGEEGLSKELFDLFSFGKDAILPSQVIINS